MSRIDIIYLLMLILSMPYGHLIKLRTNPTVKKMLCLIPGLVIGLILCGPLGLIHSFVVIVGSYGLIVLKPRYYQWINFIFVFGYLFFYRTCKHIGFPSPPKHSNAIQLLVTLRMISAGFEINQQNKDQNNNNNTETKPRRIALSQSFIDIFTYGYCYIGLMTGPFYTYQTFTDLMHQQHSKTITTVKPALWNLKYFLIVGLLYLYFKALYPLEYLVSDECLSRGFLYLVWSLYCQYIALSCRFYVGWLMAESACIFAGLGAYPVQYHSKPGQGPTTYHELKEADINDVRYDFKTINNINVIECAFPLTIRDGTKNWNMTVRWWLINYVYKNLPFKSTALKSFILLIVSAYWHGIHVGYYITFATFALYTIAEASFLKTVEPILNKTQCYWLNIITWFLASRFLEYSVLGFAFLEWEPVYIVYRHLYFYLHILTAVVMVATVVISKHLRATSSRTHVKIN